MRYPRMVVLDDVIVEIYGQEILLELMPRGMNPG